MASARTHLDDLRLANTMCSCDRLQVILWIPVGVTHDDRGRLGKIDT
jgi:hypothetical protein